MGRIRRGGYIFVSWKGDHSPRHVHIYKDGEFIGKFNLEAMVVMEGKLTRKILAIIEELVSEGEL